MLCTNCKNENKNTNIKCEYCGIEVINIDDLNNNYNAKLNQSFL